MLGMDLEEITITTAIANHEEEIGHAVTPMTAALIIADKSDAHRTCTRAKSSSIHRRNLAILDSKLSVDRASRTITDRV